MELMSSDLGSCIKERTAMQKGLSFAEAIVVMLSVASGLAHLHSIGVTHRDLKLQNILIDRRCRAPSVGGFTRTHPLGTAGVRTDQECCAMQIGRS